jgi:hypothetical protein
MDSNHRSPVKDKLVETVLIAFPAEARKRTFGGRRSQPRDLGDDLRRDHHLRDDNDRLGWGRRQGQNGGSPDRGTEGSNPAPSVQRLAQRYFRYRARAGAVVIFGLEGNVHASCLAGRFALPLDDTKSPARRETLIQFNRVTL